MYEFGSECPNCDGGGCWRCDRGWLPPWDHCPRCGEPCEVWQNAPVITIHCDHCREVFLMDTGWPDSYHDVEN